MQLKAEMCAWYIAVGEPYLFALAKSLPCVSELALQLPNVLYIKMKSYC